MLTKTLKSLFSRDLKKLRKEIELYQSEKALWVTDKGINNSGGNLCLHLVGNLNAYIGDALGKSGYVRHRDLEFSLKDVPRSGLLNQIDDTIRTVEEVLENLGDEDLQLEFPILVLEQRTSTEYFLVHLATHLSYHLGQVNYHRRLLDYPGD